MVRLPVPGQLVAGSLSRSHDRILVWLFEPDDPGAASQSGLPGSGRFQRNRLDAALTSEGGQTVLYLP